MERAARPDWIAVDWGTSNMRAYAMRGDGTVLARQSGEGMRALAGGDFERALLAAVEGWLSDAEPSPVVMCGMVGARQGWVEASYSALPIELHKLSDNLTRVPTTDGRLSVRIVPGVSQATPPDVMRGEETQLLGLLAEATAAPETVCLPGTHTKWARLKGATLTRFQTAMTGELFELLSTSSILSHSVSGAGFDEGAFLSAVEATYRDPARLTADLFAIRAGALLRGDPADSARARLSGHLIGAEIAAAKLQTGEAVALVGAKGIGDAYSQALEHLGHETQRFDGEAMVLAGLARCAEQLERAA